MDTITWAIAWNIWLVFDNVTILVRRLEENCMATITQGQPQEKNRTLGCHQGMSCSKQQDIIPYHFSAFAALYLRTLCIQAFVLLPPPPFIPLPSLIFGFLCFIFLHLHLFVNNFN
jgi:hypothetical protein